MITIDDFRKLEIYIGRIISAEKIEDTDKLLKLTVDFAEEQPRQIISGIAPYISDPQMLVGNNYPFVVNLEKRIIHGYESEGMILAVGTDDGFFSLLTADDKTPPGSKVK